MNKVYSRFFKCMLFWNCLEMHDIEMSTIQGDQLNDPPLEISLESSLETN